jgi:hypothetical protein
MSDQRPGWRKALEEPNAIGWIGFFILVIVIGFGTLYFGGNGNTNHPPSAGQAVK